jgi:hypothetical protein
MNFSVDVNMYNEKVTSYWYRFRWSHRSSEEGYSIATRRRRDAAASRMTVDTEAESSIFSK